MVTPMRVALLFVATATAIGIAQTPSDAEIQEAMERGKTTPAKKLWEEIKKKQQVRLNRAGFGDPIEKKVTFLFDRDRIALETAEAKRQLREITVDDTKRELPLGVMDVLLEANCYNNLYAGSLPKWGPNGGVHVVLKIGEKVIQPIEKTAGRADAFPYQSLFYERYSQRAWFVFPVFSSDVTTFTVVAISSDGKQKEKELAYPLK